MDKIEISVGYIIKFNKQQVNRDIRYEQKQMHEQK